MILALDTSRGTTIALVDADGTIVRRADELDTRRHAEVMDVMLAAVLGTAEVSAVVSGMGPGAFTGLRVGIAAAQAVAAGRDVPWIGLCSHDAVGFGTSGLVQVTTDVRRRERAWSVYSDGVRVDGPHVAPADVVPEVAGATRIDADWLDAATLAAASQSGATRVERAIYLREPDAVVPSVRKRVS